MVKFFLIIDKVNNIVGKSVSFLLVWMMVTTAYEVVSRYLFHRPTSWSLEFSTYALCYYSLLGGGFTLLRKGHVNVDIIYDRLGFRSKAIVDCFTWLLFFLVVIVLFWTGWEMAYRSLLNNETSGTIVDIPIFPVKIAVPLGAFLLFLQGVTKFVNDLLVAISGRSLKNHETE